ncbi:MAG TPA: NHL repeat-containing protein [Chroococcales cyanobacterium]
MKNQRANLALLSLFIGVISLTGCSALPKLERNEPSKSALFSKNGSLSVKIVVSASFSTKAKVADVERLLVQVEVQGTPQLQNIQKSQIAGPLILNFASLSAGTATISMTAFDASSQSLGTASTTASIQAGRNVQANLVLQLDPSYVYAMPSPDQGLLASTLAGGKAGYADGKGGLASFLFDSDSAGLVVDGQGNLFVADSGNDRIRKIEPDGTVSTLAGSVKGHSDGASTVAKFKTPVGIALDGSGNFFVADAGNNRIRKISPSGEVSTLAGSVEGYADGQGAVAKFRLPGGIATDGSGSIYVADTGNNLIRKISPDGIVSTFAGRDEGYADGQGAAAKFKMPVGIALDGKGNLFVADAGNNRIRKISPSGVVSTLAGSEGDYADGVGPAAMFRDPRGIAVDGGGNLYVSDKGNFRIRKIDPSGTVTTLAGSDGLYADGAGAAAKFSALYAIVLDGLGNLYLSDSQRVRKVSKN